MNQNEQSMLKKIIREMETNSGKSFYMTRLGSSIEDIVYEVENDNDILLYSQVVIEDIFNAMYKIKYQFNIAQPSSPPIKKKKTYALCRKTNEIYFEVVAVTDKKTILNTIKDNPNSGFYMIRIYD
jgi:hypothetical protein